MDSSRIMIGGGSARLSSVGVAGSAGVQRTVVVEIRNEEDGSRSKEAFVPLSHDGLNPVLAGLKIVTIQFLFVLLGTGCFIAEFSEDVVHKSLPILFGDISGCIDIAWILQILPDRLWRDITLDSDQGTIRLKVERSFLEVRDYTWVFMIRNTSEIATTQ